MLERDTKYQYNLILCVKNPKRIWIDANVEGQENDKKILKCKIIADNDNIIWQVYPLYGRELFLCFIQ